MWESIDYIDNRRERLENLPIASAVTFLIYTRVTGATGTKFLSPSEDATMRRESKTGVPITLAVVAARHPLLDGHTHQVLLCVPMKE